MIDSGVDGRNPEIGPNLVDFYNALTGQNYAGNAAAIQASFDPEGHGTHVSGIAASSNSDIGVAYHAQIIGIHALPGQGEPTPNYDTIANALNWVAANYQQYNIKVVNMSLGVPSTNFNVANPAGLAGNAEFAAIQRLENLGITVVTAAGNNYADFAVPGESVPAIGSTISVANTFSAASQGLNAAWAGPSSHYAAVYSTATPDHLNPSSQRSTLPNQVAAPGSDILSDWANGKLHAVESGTSMSAPLVSGVVALMQQAAMKFGAKPLAPSQVLSILRSTSVQIQDQDQEQRVPLVHGQPAGGPLSPLPPTGQTYDLINVYQALQAVRQYETGSSGPPQSGSTDTNNTISSAVMVPALDGTRSYTLQGIIGTDGSVSVGSNDVDLFRVQLASTGSLIAELSPGIGGVAFDSYVRVFDSSGNEIASNHGAGGGTQTLQPGTYYVGVSSYNNSHYQITDGSGAGGGQGQGSYTLLVDLYNPDPSGVIPGAVPENLPMLPQPGVIGSDPPRPGETTRVQIGSADVDMFKVTAPDDGRLDIDINVGNYVSLDPLNWGVRVFNAQGQPLPMYNASTGTLISNDGVSSAGNLQGYLLVTAHQGDVLYVAVSDATAGFYSPTNPYGRSAIGAGGQYDLSMYFDNGDQNGTAQQAVPFVIGQTVQSSVGTDPLPNGSRVTVGRDGSKDVDFIKYTPAAAGLLDVTAAGDNGFTPSLSLWTLNANQTDIVKVAETTADNTELIYPVQPGSTYYMAITGLGNEDFLWFAPASGTGGETGACTISSQLRASSDQTILSDNTITDGNVQTIATGQSMTGDIGMDGPLVIGSADIDHYRFTASATQSVVISTDTTAEGSADTVLTVYDASGNQLATNDNADPTTTGSLIRLDVVAGEQYDIAVSGSGGLAGSEGKYILSLSAAAASSGTPHQRYVTAVYQDVLDRAPDAAGLAYWTELLDNGTPIGNVAVSIGHSGEYYANFIIKPDYLSLLRRAANASDVAYWTAKMEAGLTDQQLEAMFAASDEFYFKAGNTDLAWVDQVYNLLLRRTAEAGADTYWAGQLANGRSRLQVAGEIAGSQENNSQLINADYMHYLGRAAEPGGLSFWLQQFAEGKTNEDVIAGFTGSNEYYQKHIN